MVSQDSFSDEDGCLSPDVLGFDSFSSEVMCPLVCALWFICAHELF